MNGTSRRSLLVRTSSELRAEPAAGDCWVRGNAAAGLLARVMPGQPSLSPKVVRLTLRVVRRILSASASTVPTGASRRSRRSPAEARPRRSTARARRSRPAPPARSLTVRDRGEVPFAEAGQARSVHFRAAADHVVHAGDERAAGAVAPPLGRRVAALEEHPSRRPVLRLARQAPPPLQDEDVDAPPRQGLRDGAAAHAGSSDHHVCGGPADAPAPAGRGPLNPPRGARAPARCAPDPRVLRPS
jgi:hypothetical protein